MGIVFCNSIDLAGSICVSTEQQHQEGSHENQRPRLEDYADRAGVSKQSIRNHHDDLAALGLLAIDDRGVGKATYYRLRLRFRDERGDRDAPRPLYLPDGESDRSMYSVRDVVHDVIEARGLLDEAYADRAISDGLVGWPPDLEPAVERWPWLRPWIDTIVRLFDAEAGGSLRGPGEWSEGRTR